jgi:hypothetical protein
MNAGDFKDSFTTSVVSACWSNFSFSGGTATGGHPNLVLAKGAGDFSGGWLQTADVYDLTGAGGGDTSSIQITSLPADPGGAASAFAFFQFACGVVGDGTPEFVYTPSTGELVCNGLDTSVTLTAAGLGGPLPLFWRFRGEGDGSAIHLETSADGTTWTPRAQWNQGGAHGSATIDTTQFDLLSQYCTTTVTAYNGGGPGCGCPSFPCPPAARARQWSIE